MKTPMQKMHEFLCAELKAASAVGDYPHIENAILKAEELMEEEEAAFRNFWNAGANRAFAIFNIVND